MLHGMDLGYRPILSIVLIIRVIECLLYIMLYSKTFINLKLVIPVIML